jgi:hypothetical protein
MTEMVEKRLVNRLRCVGGRTKAKSTLREKQPFLREKQNLCYRYFYAD